MPKIDILVQDKTDEQVNTEVTGVFLPLADNDPFFSITGVSLDSNYCYVITGKKTPIYEDGEYVEGVNDYIKTLVDAGFQVVVYQKQGTDDFSFLQDRSQYDVKYLTNGYDALVKFHSSTDTASVSIDDNLDELNEIATKRADCEVLGRIEPDSSTGTINNKDLITIKDLLKDNLYEVTNKDTTGCVYNRTGLFVTRHADSTKVDTFPELEYLRLYGKLMESGETWDTVAGVNRGITDVFSANSAVSKYFLDSTVQDTEGYSFNGVVDLRPYGLVMWGDRTLTYNNISETYKNSKDEYYIKTKASSYLSTMSLVCDLCKRIYNASVENTFETNNNITWTNYKTRISQLLDEMVSAGKIRTYNFVKLESNRASIRCKIYITPLAPVENFDIDVVLTDTEVSVTTGNV